MKTPHTYLIFCIIFLNGISVAFAQKNTVSSGGSITGSGGSVSYSIGQVDYLSKASVAGAITEGLQQPYEIYVITGVENTDVVLSMTVYPNPTADQLTLQVANSRSASLTYSLFDVNGKLLEVKEITVSSMDIRMKELSAGIYFLKVFDNSSELKVFKIIKY